MSQVVLEELKEKINKQNQEIEKVLMDTLGQATGFEDYITLLESYTKNYLQILAETEYDEYMPLYSELTKEEFVSLKMYLPYANDAVIKRVHKAAREKFKIF